MKRRRRIGAEPFGPDGVSFRVFAPDRAHVAVELEQTGDRTAQRLALDPEPGYWSGIISGIGAGARYRFRLAGDDGHYPDPASRFQPEGPFGPSEVVDPSPYAWTDDAFVGLSAARQVVYELHVGTFTPEGSWIAAAERLPHLAWLGVTTIELLPVTEFAGQRGWGYDGVNLFAPHHEYGGPDDLRRFVDRAHGLGLGVILDVVYNHFGPDGNFIAPFAGTYLTATKTEWGDGFNFDGDGAAATRELVKENAAYWIDEFHMDGLRIDATQAILDRSRPHILQEIGSAARSAAGERSVFLVAENEPQDAALVRPVDEGGVGLDAIWNDDFHHSALVALTGRREAYFSDYDGSARELLAAVKHGFLFQGQRHAWQKRPRGRPTRGLPPRAFVAFLENHDQLANAGGGERLWTRSDPGNYRAMTALLLLGPWTPMLFQGQEWQTSSPFAFFADHNEALAAEIRRGRLDFLSQFTRFGSAAARARLPDPGASETFVRCKLDWQEQEQPFHSRALRLHRDLLALRRRDTTLARQGMDGVRLDGAAIDERRLLIRFFDDADLSGRGDRLLLVNLGVDYEPRSLTEPLSAPPPGRRWAVRWSSAHPRYGGDGARGAAADRGIFFAGHTADLFVPRLLAPAGAPVLP